MSQTRQSVFVCDRKACLGDGTNTPATATVGGDGRPTGWLWLSGGVEIIGGVTEPANKIFHCLACLEGWATEEFFPALITMGAQ